MGRSRRNAVQKYYDRVAPRYDQSYEDDFWKWHDELTWDYLKPHLPRDLSVPVLDLGCGTGKWGVRLIHSGYAVTFVDISGRMLDRAHGKLVGSAGIERATFVQADLCDLSGLSRGAYGFALGMGDPIGCAESPPRAMKEIRRVLADDGVLVATLDNRLGAIDFYLQGGDPAVMRRFLRDGKTHWFTKSVDERFPIHTYGPGELVKLVEQAGFAMTEMLGKTVLPMRAHRHLLGTSASRRTWGAIEKRLARDPHALARASHLQFTCRALSR